jgi:quercetin dioxygenase-like cupin family protein
MEKFRAFLLACLLPALAVFCVIPSFADGYSPGIQVRILLKTDTTSLGAAVKYPEVANPEVTSIEVTIPPGAETGWHRHPVPGYAYVLSGSLTLEVEGVATRTLRAGEAYAELVGVRHNGKNSGNDPVKLIAFFTGEKGMPFTVRD